MNYQDTIYEIYPLINPAGVEASIRLQSGTLDHLSREQIASEINVARFSEYDEPGFLEKAAASFGMTADWEKWQRRADAETAESLAEKVRRYNGGAIVIGQAELQALVMAFADYK